MTKTLLFYLDQVAHLKGRRWRMSKAEEKKARQIRSLIQAQSIIDDEIFRWEAEIAKLRAFDKVSPPPQPTLGHWEFLKKISEAFNESF